MEEVETQKPLNKFRSLVDALEVSIADTGIYARKGSKLDFVLLALLSKAVRTSRAVCQLVEGGFAEDASALTRTLLDMFFTARYIAIGDAVSDARGSINMTLQKREERDDSTGRAERFVNFINRVEATRHRVGVKHNIPGVRPISPEMIELAERYPQHYSWSNLPAQTKAMATEQDPIHVDDAGNPATLTFLYEAYYSHLSHFVHPTIATLGPHVPTPGKPFRVFDQVQRPPDVRLCIVLASGFLFGVADYVILTLGATEIRKMLDRMYEFCHALGEDLRIHPPTGGRSL